MSRIALIAGAGPAGLTAALELLRRTDLRPIVIEADSQVGGISKTVNHRGNRMDLGGHRFFSKSDWVMNWWQQILPVRAEDAELDATLAYHGQQRGFRASPTASRDPSKVMLVRPRLSRIYYGRRFYDYPLKLSVQTLANLGIPRTLAIGASYARAQLRPRDPEATLEDFLINRFGHHLYLTFFKSYTEKVWGVPCHEISAEWGAQRIKGLSVTKALLHAARSLLPASRDVAQRGTETSLIERFLYPRLGPGQMWEEVAEHVVAAGGEIHLGHRVVAIHREGTRVTGADVLDSSTGTVRRVDCDTFFSTMPVSDLARMLGPGAPEVASTAAGLPYRDFMTAGLLVRKMRPAALRGQPQGSRMPPDNWIYVQEPDVKLGRLQVFNNWSPDMVRDPDTIWLGLEYFCREGDELWGQPDASFLDFAARELEQIDLIDRHDVLDGTVVRVPKAYPAYFGEYRNIGRVRDWLDGFANLYPIGRNGMHRYNNQDHSMLAAKAAVDAIAGTADKRAIWSVNTEEDYHEETRAERRAA